MGKEKRSREDGMRAQRPLKKIFKYLLLKHLDCGSCSYVTINIFLLSVLAAPVRCETARTSTLGIFWAHFGLIQTCLRMDTLSFINAAGRGFARSYASAAYTHQSDLLYLL